MKKRIKFRKLGRTSSHKWAMLRNMVTSLIKHERIVTTTAKAKELKYLADHVITLAKSDNQLSGIRHADKIIREKPVLTKLFQVLGPRYEKREGGYTRILKLSKNRQGDGAEMAVMEYVDRPGELRAARPPTSVQQEIMAQYLKEKIGLEPLAVNDVESLEEDISKLSVDEETDDSDEPRSDTREEDDKH